MVKRLCEVQYMHIMTTRALGQAPASLRHLCDDTKRTRIGNSDKLKEVCGHPVPPIPRRIFPQGMCGSKK